MNLTPSGRRLCGTVIAHAFGSLDEFRRECSDEPIELSIGAGEGIIQWLLLPRLSEFLKNHPGITVSFQNLRNDDIRRAVADGSLDFGVVTRAQPAKSLAITPLGPLEYRLFVPKALAKTAPKPGPELIGQLPLGMLRSSDTIRMALNEAAEKHGFKLSVRVSLSSYPQLAAAVQQLQLAAVMPAIAGAALPACETLSVRLPLLDALQRQLSLVWSRKAAEVRPAVATYSQVLSQAFRISGGGLTQQREPPLHAARSDLLSRNPPRCAIEAAAAHATVLKTGVRNRTGMDRCARVSRAAPYRRARGARRVSRVFQMGILCAACS